MSELTDDQLDGLFRKSAEEFDPPFDPASWQDMKTRLDTHDRIAPGGTPIWKNLLRWGLPVVLLLLLTVGGWYAMRKVAQSDAHQREKRPATAVPQSTLTTAQSKPLDATRLNEASAAQKKSAELPEQLINTRTKPTDLAKPVLERNTLSNRRDESVARVQKLNRSGEVNATDDSTSAYKVNTEPNRTARPRIEALPEAAHEKSRTTNRAGTKKAGQPSTQRQVKTGRNRREASHSEINYGIPAALSFNKQPVQTRLESGRVADARTTGNVTTPESEKTESVSIPTLSELAIRPARWSPALAFKGRDVVAQPDTTAHKSVSKPEAMRGLSVRLAVAPDLSSIGLKNFTRPGTNVGVLLEYRLVSRWSVQAGVIQSTKIYTARTTQYELPYPIMKQTVKPESVNGECRMFDIPINLRYDVVLRPRLDGRPPSRWFVSGGVTSYIIKKEDYVYNYPPHTYNVIPGWSGEGSTSTGGFGFSQLNLSAGYERAINKRLSWQVEPFIKAPLRGVGYLKINLLSTGAFFSIRYKL